MNKPHLTLLRINIGTVMLTASNKATLVYYGQLSLVPAGFPGFMFSMGSLAAIHIRCLPR